MMPMSAPRPRILDITEIRSSIPPSGAICCLLEIVEFKMFQNIPQLNLAVPGYEVYGDLEARRVYFGVRLLA